MYQEIAQRLVTANMTVREPDGKIHPSSVSLCKRQGIYSTLGVPRSDDRTAASERALGMGTNIHADFQKELINDEPRVLVEVDIDWPPIKGSADILYPVPVSVEQFGFELHELKSASAWKFRQYAKNGPAEEHETQTRMYHYCLKQMGYKLTDTIRIVYINKDNYEVVEWTIEPYDEAGEAKFLADIAELEAHIVDRTLPPAREVWLCKYCEWRTRCATGETEV